MDYANWLDWAALLIVLVAGLAGLVLTIITLPGTWVTVGAGVGVCLWRPDLISWWAVAVALVLAGLGELIELIASAVGASRAGGTKKGAAGAILGSLLGALLGAPFLFPIGSIAGAAVGAGVGTLVAERGIAGKSWRDSARAGGGAAAGRLVAIVLKTGIAAGIALALAASVLVPGF